MGGKVKTDVFSYPNSYLHGVWGQGLPIPGAHVLTGQPISLHTRHRESPCAVPCVPAARITRDSRVTDPLWLMFCPNPHRFLWVAQPRFLCGYKLKITDGRSAHSIAGLYHINLRLWDYENRLGLSRWKKKNTFSPCELLSYLQPPINWCSWTASQPCAERPQRASNAFTTVCSSLEFPHTLLAVCPAKGEANLARQK